MDSGQVWTLLVLAAAATYASRLLGVVLAGRIAASGPLLEWVACVAYALLAGLVSRMLLMPIGPLTVTEWPERVVAVVAALAVFFVTRRNVLLGVLAGTGLLALLA